ncbi:Uncharacterised protein [Vibrio cholerae]|nr:Uncharacterised protein [Vibrio cholerae]
MVVTLKLHDFPGDKRVNKEPIFCTDPVLFLGFRNREDMGGTNSIQWWTFIFNIND